MMTHLVASQAVAFTLEPQTISVQRQARLDGIQLSPRLGRNVERRATNTRTLGVVEPSVQEPGRLEVALIVDGVADMGGGLDDIGTDPTVRLRPLAVAQRQKIVQRHRLQLQAEVEVATGNADERVVHRQLAAKHAAKHVQKGHVVRLDGDKADEVDGAVLGPSQPDVGDARKHHHVVQRRKRVGIDDLEDKRHDDDHRAQNQGKPQAIGEVAVELALVAFHVLGKVVEEVQVQQRGKAVATDNPSGKHKRRETAVALE